MQQCPARRLSSPLESYRDLTSTPLGSDSVELEASAESWARLYDSNYQYFNVSHEPAPIASNQSPSLTQPNVRKLFPVQIERASSSALAPKLTVDRNSHSTELVSAFDLIVLGDPRGGPSFAATSSTFSCDIVSEDASGPRVRVQIQEAVAYVEGNRLWCYHEFANGPLLAFPGEVKDIKLTLEVSISETKPVGVSGAGLVLANGTRAEFALQVEILQDSPSFAEALALFPPVSGTHLELGNLT